MRVQWNLFLAFFRVGMLGYGGGPGSIPLIHIETVEKYKWVTDEEFGDILALCNTLPGPIITKMAGYIGHRESGFLGMINAVIASILPTIFLMIILLASLSSISNFDWVSGMTTAVIPVVGVMLAVLTWQFLEKAGKGLGWKKTIIMSAIILVILKLGVHPGIVIGALLVLALVQKDKSSSEDEKQKAREGAGQ
ncbi:chromate transporter [Virgibacillus ihumii]|uniref:chromate transporter n=1 Tax=Virgibacillus ihumii TaxID=2686091 RepID=UPI00157D7FFC|nr:chromate transporter [Virgibacillus ihumii]